MPKKAALEGSPFPFPQRGNLYSPKGLSFLGKLGYGAVNSCEVITFPWLSV